MEDKKNNIKKHLLTHKFLLALLILEAVGIFVIGVLFPAQIILIFPFGIKSTFFEFFGLLFIISLYVLTTYFLATHEKYILIFFIVGIIMSILVFPLFLLLITANGTSGFYPFILILLFFSSSFIMYSVFPPSLMLLILKHIKLFEKQNALIKTIIITAMMFPLILFAHDSNLLIFIYAFVTSEI